MNDPIDNIIFFHLPKAGGTTLHRIIEKQYPPDETFTIRVVNKTELTTRQFIDMPPEKRNRIKMLKGHMRFGLHVHFDGCARYITMLREPVDRVVSFYYYVKSNPNNRLYDTVMDQKMSLRDFVLNIDAGDVNNGQARMLAGFGVPEEQLLETAMRHLKDHFAVVGITEKFDRSLLLMKKRLGWSYPVYRRQNVNQKRKKISELSADLIDLIREKNQMDVSLYAFADALFEEAFRKDWAFFQKELMVFKYRNLLRRLFPV